MSKINVKPEISELKITEIYPSPYNPREISQEALAGLRHSLEKFGLVDLLVVNKRNMRIISGHQRYKILQDDGVETVTAILVDLDEISEMAMNVTLNSQEIAGVWTEAIMPILDKLRSGMSEDYLSLRMDSLRAELSELEIENMGAGETLPDDIPDIPEEPMTRPGDLWILGEHRLLCGDSTSDLDVSRLMDGQKASLFATDPPYCVDYTGADRPNGGKDWSDTFREIDISDPVAFMQHYFRAGLKVIKERTPIYLWHASKRIHDIQHVADELDILIHQHIIWVKPCGVLTFSFYSWRHEPCLLMWVKGQSPSFKPKQKSIGTVWPIDYLKSGDPVVTGVLQ